MKVDHKLLENLIRILNYEYKIYSSILEIATKKTDSLIHNNLDEIRTMTSRENELAGQAQQLNDAREQIIADICASLGLENKKIKISELKDKVTAPFREQLENISHKLSDCIGKLQERNRINQKLIETAIQYIDFSMQLMVSPQPEASVYGKTGHEVSGTAKKSVLDIKY